jgi:hypothetical protein
VCILFVCLFVCLIVCCFIVGIMHVRTENLCVWICCCLGLGNNAAVVASRFDACLTGKLSDVSSAPAAGSTHRAK